MNAIEDRLAAAGITLPEAPLPAANYVPATIGQGLLFVSGQLPFEGGRMAVAGKVGGELTVDDGIRAARLCAINVLAQAKAALDGDLERIARCLKLQGFVACATDFVDHPKVVNGASDLVVLALGDAGRHARFAVGVASLPLGAAVEVDATFALR